MMKMYVASDGWPFYLQPDGTLTDTPDPSESDLGWNGLDEFSEMDEGMREATQAEREHFANVRKEHDYG